jgi:hypothetical protein
MSNVDINSDTSKYLAIGEQQNINFWNDLNSLDRRGKLDTRVSKNIVVKNPPQDVGVLRMIALMLWCPSLIPL